MKKYILIALATILVLAVGYTYAVEVTLLGPKQYARTQGSPNLYNDSFIGKAGQGKIVIRNGGVDSANLVSSAIVKLNGVAVFGVNDFNQHAWKLEKSVSLNDTNSLSVELRSEPGSFLTIELSEEIEAAGAAVIGSSGGTASVEDPSNPLFGTKIEIPSGSLDKPYIITISESPMASNISDVLRSDLMIAGPLVDFGPKGLAFSNPALVTIRYYDLDNDGYLDGTRIPEANLKAIMLDDEGAETDINVVSQDLVGNTLLVTMPHFTSVVAISSSLYTTERWDMNVGQTGWTEDSQEGYNPPINIERPNQINYGVPFQNAISARLWFTAGTEERIKIRTDELYPSDNDAYIWRIFIPFMEPRGRASIGAFLYNDDDHEFDFEIGYGNKNERDFWKATPDEVLCYMINRSDPSDADNQKPIKVKAGTWHEFEMRIGQDTNNPGQSDLSFAVDSVIYRFKPLLYSLKMFSVLCSVEYQPYMGDGDQYRINNPEAYFDYVLHKRPSSNLVPNPSFEYGSGKWPYKWEPYRWQGIPGAGEFMWDTTTAHSGSRSVGITGCNNTDWLIWRSDYIPVEPRTYYEIQFWYSWSLDSFNGAYLTYGWSSYDENFNKIGGWNRGVSNNLSAGWRKETYSGWSGNYLTVKYIRLEFGHRGWYPPYSATVRIDDVQLKKK